MKTFVVVRLQFEGIHCWPECPIEEVSFLRHPHRHVFHVKLTKEVAHNDRDVEIIQLKRKVEVFCLHQFSDAGRMSCEDMATRLVNEYDLASAEVLEDGENGAIVYANGAIIYS